ncbi:monothiol glutaredoxin-S6-like [Rutidosis leptorrhynchoides]|uniref:monothiol glutaredoxin-S6-like n=1 Tax=Rutidosis leptorrhynchoides TaxID=125765 RepID=UPI003A997F9D
MATVTALVTDRPVVVFSKSTCCMSYTITTLISSFGANPVVYEIDKHPEGEQIEKELKELGCKPSSPAVFIGGKLIGGANEIMSLQLKGQLQQLLLKAKAIWI